MAIMELDDPGGDILNSKTAKDRSLLVTTVSQMIVPKRYRDIIFLKNDTNVDIWINFDEHAVASAGNGNFKLPPGAYWEMSRFKSAIYAIVASGTANLTAREL